MNRLMTHVVVGYPDLATTKRLIRAMTRRKVAAIELQIPFSDPIADGPVLMRANDVAVAQGISVEDTLKLLATIKKQDTKIYIMTYLQPVMHYGPKIFFQKALAAGCNGFIIPDLPFDAPETEDFITDNSELRHALVPVLSPGMPEDRLKAVFKTLEPGLVYLTARHGITGDRTHFGSHLNQTVQTIHRLSKAELAIGFGIQTPADVRQVLGLADLAIVGSALTDVLDRSEHDALRLLSVLLLE
jgi:tryptophan synthase alpha chain